MQSRATKGEGNTKDNAGQSAQQDKAKGIKNCETGRRAGQGGPQVVKSEVHCAERGRAKGRAKQDWRQGEGQGKAGLEAGQSSMEQREG